MEGGAKLPSPIQQAANLLRYIGDRLSQSGQPIRGWAEDVSAVIGAPNARAGFKLLFELLDRGLVKGQISRTISGPPTMLNLEPTLDGWEAYEREATGQLTGRTAIIAMKFGDPHLDAFVDSVVKPAVSPAVKSPATRTPTKNGHDGARATRASLSNERRKLRNHPAHPTRPPPMRRLHQNSEAGSPEANARA